MNARKGQDMRQDNHSESLPELSESLESDERSLSPATCGAGRALGFEKRAMRSSSILIFSASTSSSMLFRFKPPVPVPFPVRFRFVAGARMGRITKLYNFVKTDAGSVSISNSISSVL
jgi:hypothetical protein